MLVSMTSTLMQAHSGSTENQIQRWIISTTKQVINIKLATTVCLFLFCFCASPWLCSEDMYMAWPTCFIILDFRCQKWAFGDGPLGQARRVYVPQSNHVLLTFVDKRSNAASPTTTTLTSIVSISGGFPWGENRVVTSKCATLKTRGKDFRRGRNLCMRWLFVS